MKSTHQIWRHVFCGYSGVVLGIAAATHAALFLVDLVHLAPWLKVLLFVTILADRIRDVVTKPALDNGRPAPVGLPATTKGVLAIWLLYVVALALAYVWTDFSAQPPLPFAVATNWNCSAYLTTSLAAFLGFAGLLRCLRPEPKKDEERLALKF